MTRALRVAGFFLLALAGAAAWALLARGPDVVAVHFLEPRALWLLLLVPVALLWGTWGQDRRRPRLRVGLLKPLVKGPRGLRAYLADAPGAIRAVVLAAFAIALARPVDVLRNEAGDERGIDIVVVMDLSGSMRAVLDGNPKDLPGAPDLPRGKRLTRLDTAKVVVRDFIGRRKTDRIGVVVFGKSAFVLSPPTLDYQLVAQLVSKLSLHVIDGDGTAIGDALGTAVARLRRSEAQSKVVILLTDGDNKGGSISPDYATKLAQKVGAKVYTVQIGTDDEVEVEDTDLTGRYLRQRFPVNPELLRRIAKETGGEAFVATDGKALADSMHTILDRLERTRFEAITSSYQELYAFALVPGAVLLALEALLRAVVLRRFP